MSELDDVRAEVATLREEVARLRDEAADTRALAAMADRDAAGVRSAVNAINSTQNALRETQVEHGRTLHHIAEAVGVLVTGQAALTESVRRQDEARARHDAILEQLAAGQSEILLRLAAGGPDTSQD